MKIFFRRQEVALKTPPPAPAPATFTPVAAFFPQPHLACRPKTLSWAPFRGTKEGKKQRVEIRKAGNGRASVEEARYNAALELAIEEDNDKAGYIQNSEKEDDEL